MDYGHDKRIIQRFNKKLMILNQHTIFFVFYLIVYHK